MEGHSKSCGNWLLEEVVDSHEQFRLLGKWEFLHKMILNCSNYRAIKFSWRHHGFNLLLHFTSETLNLRERAFKSAKDLSFNLNPNSIHWRFFCQHQILNCFHCVPKLGDLHIEFLLRHHFQGILKIEVKYLSFDQGELFFNVHSWSARWSFNHIALDVSISNLENFLKSSYDGVIGPVVDNCDLVGSELILFGEEWLKTLCKSCNVINGLEELIDFCFPLCVESFDLFKMSLELVPYNDLELCIELL